VVRSQRAALYADPAGRVPAETLGRGDGLTLTSTRGALLRTTTRRYVRRADVEIVNAPAKRGQDLRALPRPARYRLGWLVPDPGEPEVPLLLPARLAAASPAGVAAATAGEVRLVPRYTVVMAMQDGPAGPGPGPGPGDVPVEVRLEKDGEVLRGAVRARHLRRLLPAPIPPDLQPGERWIDISLSQQVAAAYEGDEPVFATLVSTGKRGSTPPGTFFIERKYRVQTMANLQGAASRYDFRQVPWAQFFHGRIGLHSVLWHDQLGHPVSHGCVNLSPPDAERLFAFTDPPLPPGWHAVLPPAKGALRDGGGTRVVVRR
jgi:lipoprotein-anchoring transpeptidase ErfK/SrfK